MKSRINLTQTDKLTRLVRSVASEKNPKYESCLCKVLRWIWDKTNAACSWSSVLHEVQSQMISRWRSSGTPWVWASPYVGGQTQLRPGLTSFASKRFFHSRWASSIMSFRNWQKQRSMKNCETSLHTACLGDEQAESGRYLAQVSFGKAPQSGTTGWYLPDTRCQIPDARCECFQSTGCQGSPWPGCTWDKRWIFWGQVHLSPSSRWLQLPWDILNVNF